MHRRLQEDKRYQPCHCSVHCLVSFGAHTAIELRDNPKCQALLDVNNHPSSKSSVPTMELEDPIRWNPTRLGKAAVPNGRTRINHHSSFQQELSPHNGARGSNTMESNTPGEGRRTEWVDHKRSNKNLSGKSAVPTMEPEVPTRW